MKTKKILLVVLFSMIFMVGSKAILFGDSSIKPRFVHIDIVEPDDPMIRIAVDVPSIPGRYIIKPRCDNMRTILLYGGATTVPKKVRVTQGLLRIGCPGHNEQHLDVIQADGRESIISCHLNHLYPIDDLEPGFYTLNVFYDTTNIRDTNSIPGYVHDPATYPDTACLNPNDGTVPIHPVVVPVGMTGFSKE